MPRHRGGSPHDTFREHEVGDVRRDDVRLRPVLGWRSEAGGGCSNPHKTEE